MRVGFGYDSHRFEDGKKLVLGGVVFDGERGLKAHSDGDVVIHAVIDALLGAVAMGDIGSHFPDTDERYLGADSCELLSKAVGEIRDAGYEVGNIDITVICERPKILPRKDEMIERISGVIGCDKGRISIKGKTNEGMDDVGVGRGIEVHAVATVEEKTNFRGGTK